MKQDERESERIKQEEKICRRKNMQKCEWAKLMSSSNRSKGSQDVFARTSRCRSRCRCWRRSRRSAQTLLITQMRSAGLVVLGRDFGPVRAAFSPSSQPPFINIILIWVSETNGR